MENSASNDWFNAQLFTLNGAPLKFNLHGYSQTESYEIVKIIEAYGGKLSTPDDPDTFIFGESDSPVGTENQDLYDIQYFHDTILALQPQDLITYKHELCSSKTKEKDVDNLNENKIVGPITKLQINHLNKNNHSEVDENRAQYSPKDDDTQRVDKMKWVRPIFSEDDNQTIIKWLKKKNILPSKAGMKIWHDLLKEKVLPRLDLTVWKLVGHFKRELCRHPAFFKYSKDFTTARRKHKTQAKPSHLMTGKINNNNESMTRDRSYRYTVEENRVLLQYVIDNHAVRKKRGIHFWTECLKASKASLQKTRTARSLYFYFERRLCHQLAKFKEIAPGKKMGK